MPATALARRYLAAYHAGEEIPGGLAFAKALGQARLDYSPDSLGRIDQLLIQIRQKLRPEFATFLAVQENQNFLYLLCFYAGEVVARYTGRSIEWYPHEELVERLPPEAAAGYPQCFATSMACVLDDSAFFVPLSSMQEILFEEGSGRSLLAAADQFMRRAVGVPVLDPAAVAPARRPDAFPPELEAVGRFVGMAAAFAVWQVCEGQPLIPMLSQEMPSGQKLNTSLMQDDLGKAIDTGLKRLELGGEGALHAVLAYDGYVNLPGFRTDALILEA
ncbi:MAG: hypothetical protein JNM82_03960, partial [Rhodocyclaceae bacterium]|nr:hypothetical protein [Rhodocyclaceae bacterium]